MNDAQIRLALPSKGRMEAETLEFLAGCGLRVDKRNPRQYTATLPALATRTIRQNSLRVGDQLEFVGSVLSNNIAAGGNVVKGYINGIGSGVLFTAPSVTFAANDVVDFRIRGRVQSIGASGSLALSGFVGAGVPGTATARVVVGSLTINTTVDNVVTIANTPSNIADSSTLQFLSVDRQ